MKTIKIYGVPWHTSHQRELANLPFVEEYALQINPYRYWGDVQRPMPSNMHYVTHYEKGYYDLAILHIDQQSIYNPEKGDRISKGRLYGELNSIVDDIPKVVINHMTPFHDKYETDEIITIIKKMVGNNVMIVNSHEAGKQWGWGYSIIHGLNPDDWFDLKKEPRCIVSLSPAGMEKAYRRIFLETVARILKVKKVPFYWINVDITFNTFDDYRNFIGRSLVYFNPTWQSPMPRSRTEAMMSGACIVTTPYQDADTFIVNGVNGFLTSKAKITDPRIMDNPQYAADLIERLVLKEPDLAIKIGKEGKKTAIEKFHVNNFILQWAKMLKDKLNIDVDYE